MGISDTHERSDRQETLEKYPFDNTNTENGVFVSRGYIGKICAHCNRPLTEDDRVIFCDACGLPYHLSCWQDHHGCVNAECGQMNTSPEHGMADAEIPGQFPQDAQTVLSEGTKPFFGSVDWDKLRKSKITLVVATAVATALLVCLTLFFAGRSVCYHSACENLENGLYDVAYILFSSLDDYKDSADKAKEALYKKATSEMRDQQYDAAYEILAGLGNYEDSAQLAKEALYQKAINALRNKQYDTAYAIFSELGDYEDSAQLAKEALYQKATDALQNKQYDAAYELFSGLGDYKDSSDMAKETLYQKGKSLMEEESYDEAIVIFTMIIEYKDSFELVSESLYQKACGYLDREEYTQAVSVFETITYYKDSTDKLKEAKYGYVLANRNNDDTTTYDYLISLKEGFYKDSAAIYQELYTWKVTILGWNSDKESTVYQTQISRFMPVYCHIAISGGPPGGGLTFSFSGTTPDGGKFENTSSTSYEDGMEGWIFWRDGLYTNPEKGAIGRLFIYVFDSEGKLIGSSSVNITL
jgi:outer membrane protein assembly factor BamD (BamD/ComL family)